MQNEKNVKTGQPGAVNLKVITMKVIVTTKVIYGRPTNKLASRPNVGGTIHIKWMNTNGGMEGENVPVMFLIGDKFGPKWIRERVRGKWEVKTVK